MEAMEENEVSDGEKLPTITITWDAKAERPHIKHDGFKYHELILMVLEYAKMMLDTERKLMVQQHLMNQQNSIAGQLNRMKELVVAR